ncbi:hypothetical protein ADM96_20415 [Burkholderia sp. ST111]|nr:hypothetical protein ADM96_20415 [Burkholderia sp. ST111]
MPNVFQITISAVDRATAVAKGVNASIGKITKPISDVKASVQAFSKETGLDKLGDRLVKVGGVASDAARRIGSIAPPLAAISAAGSIAGLATMAHSWGRTATEIANTASVIDVTTDQLQKYRGAARLAGLSDADMTSGLKSVGSAFEDAAAGRDTFVAGVLSSKNIGVHRMADGSVNTIRALHDISNAAAKINERTGAREVSRYLWARLPRTTALEGRRGDRRVRREIREARCDDDARPDRTWRTFQREHGGAGCIVR